MEKVKDFLKRYMTITLTVAALGVGITIGYGANGCSVDVAPKAPAVTE